MAENVICPEIKDILSENECLENVGGLGVNVYIFIKSDLAAPLSPEAGKNTYAALSAASLRVVRVSTNSSARMAVRVTPGRTSVSRRVSSRPWTTFLRA